MKLDRIDIKILHELQKNGRVTNVELAELVSLSPSPCLIRVKKLQAEGYIEGYSAQINMTKLGQTLTVFTEVTLKNHRQIDFARFLAAPECLFVLLGRSGTGKSWAVADWSSGELQGRVRMLTTSAELSGVRSLADVLSAYFTRWTARDWRPEDLFRRVQAAASISGQGPADWVRVSDPRLELGSSFQNVPG